MKRYSTSLAFREMQTHTIMNSILHPFGWPKFDNTKVEEDMDNEIS